MRDGKIWQETDQDAPAPRTALGHWQRLWADLGAAGDSLAWHLRLIRAYSEKPRHYHTLEHLNECLCEFDAVRSQALQPALVEIALWFHDAIYDPHSSINEEESAALSVSCLKGAQLPHEKIETVRQFILCTKTHQPGSLSDASLLIDIDLAILGQPPERFWAYENAIAAEYAWVPGETFRRKRAEILNGFLRRATLYRTAFFRHKYEAVARANLAAAIARLNVSLH